MILAALPARIMACVVWMFVEHINVWATRLFDMELGFWLMKEPASHGSLVGGIGQYYLLWIW
jgi:hypothetical protein